MLPDEIVCFQSCSPRVLAQSRTRSPPSAEVRKMRSSQTVGVEPAGPGKGSRQTTFSVLLQVVGSPVSLLRPSSRAPRHCGQFSAWVAAAGRQAKTPTITTRKELFKFMRHRVEGFRRDEWLEWSKAPVSPRSARRSIRDRGLYEQGHVRRKRHAPADILTGDPGRSSRRQRVIYKPGLKAAVGCPPALTYGQVRDAAKMKITTIPQFYRNLNNLHRWREIIAVLSKYGLADWLSRFDFGLAKGFFRDHSGEALANLSRETRIRLALTELGPTFIKLGQVLSTRGDLVGTRLADELQQLQTDVACDAPDVVRATLARELGRPLDEIFSAFEDTPIASASIGQVHRAWLISGQKVAVKVQHAGIEDQVRVDLDILAGLAPFAERIPEFSNYRPRATVAEFQRMLRRELDFLREQRNLLRFAQDLAGQPDVRIPAPFPELSTSRVLTMEFLDGIKLSDAVSGQGNGYDLEHLARTGAKMYLEMIFANGVYHADPHPGNLILLDHNTLGLVDFGMVGRIDETLREAIEEMLLAILDQDAEQVTTIITRLGAVPSNLDYATLGIDVADFVAQYGHQNLSEFSLSAALTDVTEIIRRYHIMLPARAAMLLKVLIMLEGTARLVSPDFSLMELIGQYRHKMLWRRMSPKRRIKKISRIYSEFERLAEILPRRLTEMLGQMQSGKFDVHLDHRGLEPSVNRLALGMLVSALFLGSSLLLSHNVPPLVRDVSLLGSVGMSISIVLGLRLLWAINKSGHLDRRE